MSTIQSDATRFYGIFLHNGFSACREIHRKLNAANEETYASVEKMIYRLAWKATKKYGGDFNDYLTEANEGYCIAYRTWTPDRKCSFSSHCWNCVFHEIQDYVARRKDVPTEDLSLVPETEERGLGALLCDLGEDARTIVQLVLEAPGDLAAVLRFRKAEKIRRGLWQYAHENLSWDMGRTSAAFEEISQALS